MISSKDADAKLQAALNELACQRESESLPDIAASLEALCHLYMELGRPEDALTSIDEAVKLRHQCAVYDSAVSPQLAVALQLRGQQLAKLKRLDDAVVANEEAISILRPLCEKDPGEYLPALAGSLHNLGYSFGLLGDWRKAVSATDEAIEIRRRLIKDDRTNYLALLAAALHNLSHYHSKLHHPQLALRAASESTELRRQALEESTSSAQELEAYNSLSESLHALSACQVTLKHYPGAARTSSANLQTVWHLVWHDSPSAYVNHLTTTLHNSSTHLHQAGRSSEAISAAEESVHIRRDLARDDPDTHLPQLAQSLNTLANYLWKAGRTCEAVLAADEAVSSYRELGAEHAEQLAFSLYNLGVYLESEGRLEEATRARDEALKINPQLRHKSPRGLFKSLVGKVVNGLKWFGSRP